MHRLGNNSLTCAKDSSRNQFSSMSNLLSQCYSRRVLIWLNHFGVDCSKQGLKYLAQADNLNTQLYLEHPSHAQYLAILIMSRKSFLQMNKPLTAKLTGSKQSVLGVDVFVKVANSIHAVLLSWRTQLSMRCHQIRVTITCHKIPNERYSCLHKMVLSQLQRKELLQMVSILLLDQKAKKKRFPNFSSRHLKPNHPKPTS